VKTNETTQTNFYSRSSDGAGAILCLSERMSKMRIKRIPAKFNEKFLEEKPHKCCDDYGTEEFIMDSY